MLVPVINAVGLTLNGVFLLFSSVYTMTERDGSSRAFIFVFLVVVT